MDWLLVSALNGISYGVILFLLASGFSLIFGVMGIANLAHGALYMVGGYVGWTLAVQLGLNYWLALVAGGLGAGLIGLLLERGFLRYLHNLLNEQVLLTFGFVYIITNLSLWIWGPVVKPGFTAPMLSGTFQIGQWNYPVSRASLIILGIVLAAGLWWLQNKTRVGAIIRAGMDNREMTMGLGINLNAISIGVFFIGSFLAGFAGVAGASLMNVHLQLGVNVLVLALVVVVVGGMGSVEGALLGGMLIGLIDSFGRTFFPELAMFTIYLVMIIILLARPSGLLGKAQAVTNPMPVQSYWQGRGNRLIPLAIAGVIFVVLPAFLPSYFQMTMTKIIIFALFAVSLDIVFGYTGLLAFGHAAFFGIAGYTTGILAVHYGIRSLWLGASAGVLGAALLSALFGVIAMRVSGIYFLLVTFALGELLASLAIKWEFMSSSTAAEGLFNITRPELGFPFAWNTANFYYFALIIFVVSFFLLYRLVNSPFGYVLRGIRESEARMRALGYNTWLYKYVAFIIAGAFAGVAGVLIAYHNGFMAPVTLGVTTSALAMLMVIIGGVGTLYGPAIGAVVLILVEVFASMYTPERWPLILGAAFVAAVMFARGGIIIYLNRLWQRVTVRWRP